MLKFNVDGIALENALYSLVVTDLLVGYIVICHFFSENNTHLIIWQ